VDERRKFWLKDLSISPSSVDSSNMNEQERLADFDRDSADGDTTEEEVDSTTCSPSATKVCTTLI